MWGIIIDAAITIAKWIFNIVGTKSEQRKQYLIYINKMRNLGLSSVRLRESDKSQEQELDDIRNGNQDD